MWSSARDKAEKRKQLCKSATVSSLCTDQQSQRKRQREKREERKKKKRDRPEREKREDGRSRLMDDTLTILSPEPMRMVTKLNRKSLKALENSGHHRAPRKKQEVSEAVQSARLCFTSDHSSSGTCQLPGPDGCSNISATSFSLSMSPCHSRLRNQSNFVLHLVRNTLRWCVDPHRPV